MRKNLIKLSVLATILFCVAFCFYNVNVVNKSSKVNELAIQNIEALASGEDVNFACYGEGEVDCYGEKVKYKIEGLNFGY